MAQCFVSEQETRIFQYVRFTEAPRDDQESRVLFCRFDSLAQAHQRLPDDFAEPITVRWNPGPKSDSLGLDEHRRLSGDPGLRGLPNMVRASVTRNTLRQKLSQFIAARNRLLNP